MNAIAGGRCLHQLRYLLEFLAAWERRPAYLTPIAYQWCSAISEVAGRPNRSEISTTNKYFGRLRPQNLVTYSPAEREFSEVGPRCDPLRLDAASHRAHGHTRRVHSHIHAYLLSIALDIGFRRVVLSRDWLALRLDHTSHHEWVFESAFSSDDDEIIADAMCVWIVDRTSTPPGSPAHYLARRVEKDTSFSPRLWQASVSVIGRMWDKEFEVSTLEIVRWLNCLNIGADDMVKNPRWAWRLVDAIRSPIGLENLSSHYWHLLPRLVVASKLSRSLKSRDMEVVRSLEKAEEWEKLEAWMVVVWSFLPGSTIPKSESMEGIKEITLKSLLRQPSALSRFENLCESGNLSNSRPACQEFKAKLQHICDQARAEKSPSESPPPS